MSRLCDSMIRNIGAFFLSLRYIKNEVSTKIKVKKEMEEKQFILRGYDKVELALLYSPRCNDAAALQTLYRWIQKNEALKQGLADMGYNKYRHRFLKQEVELIVSHLGEP